MKTKEILLRTCAFCAGLYLLSQWCGNADGQVLFFDNFEQFANGTDLTSTSYTPASGPASASVVTSVQNGSPTITATNFLGSIRAFFDNSVVINKNQYKGYLSSIQTSQTLQVTWKMWIRATNSGPGMFLFSIPTSDPNANFNPPITFMDTGVIIALTNGTSVQTRIGHWGSLAGTVMTNTLILNYPGHTFSYSLNGQTLAALPFGPYFTNVVDAIYFNGFERSAGSLGNRFAIDDVRVELATPLAVTTTSLPNGTNGVAYGQTLAASGGLTPYTWTNSSGALAPGLTLAANGVISGTPTTNGPFSFTVKVTDALSATATRPLTLTVGSPANFTFTTNNGTITITGYTGPGGAVTFPTNINGLLVTGIGNGQTSVFPSNNVTSVTIPNSVTSIGDWAFQNCTNLTSLTIPNSVISIGFQAFQLCTGLTNVTIGTNVTSIGDGAFYSCTSLTSVTIPNSVTNIGSSAFDDCTSLTSATIGNGVRSIWSAAFYYCTSLTNITIGTNVTSIGDVAFYACTSLASVTIPNSVTSIGTGAFWECNGLTSITIGTNVTRIGPAAFDSCYGLTNVTFGNSVTSIGTNAFGFCTSLTGVYFQGNAPTPANDCSVFSGDMDVTVYYLPGTTGWGTTFDCIPTALWFLPNPRILTSSPSFGVQSNQFGFIISWATNISVVVEASTNLANPTWYPVETNTLTGGTSYFSDPNWANYTRRFYRLRSP